MWSPSRRRPASGTPMVVGLVALPQGEDLRARASRRRVSELLPSVASSRASARWPVWPRVGRPRPPGRLAAWAASLQLAQQPLRSIDHRRRRHLVAHRPLAPQVLVPLQRGGHRGGDVGEVGQRAGGSSAGIAPAPPHEVDDGQLGVGRIGRRAGDGR